MTDFNRGDVIKFTRKTWAWTRDFRTVVDIEYGDLGVYVSTIEGTPDFARGLEKDKNYREFCRQNRVKYFSKLGAIIVHQKSLEHLRINMYNLRKGDFVHLKDFK